MIIVSQDKMEIINLDRVTEISVSKNYICVTDRIEQKAGYIIATYKTEERAKEVLKEIVESIIKNRTIDNDNSALGFSIIASNTYYEMPED